MKLRERKREEEREMRGLMPSVSSGLETDLPKAAGEAELEGHQNMNPSSVSCLPEAYPSFAPDGLRVKV